MIKFFPLMKIFIFLLLGFLSLLANASVDVNEHCQQVDNSYSSIMLSADVSEHQDCPQCAVTYFTVNKVLKLFVFIDKTSLESMANSIYNSKLSKVDNPPPINS